MKMYSKDKVEMMHVKDFYREGEHLVMKGKVMGSMPMTIYISPKDVWEGKKFISWSILWYMPILLIKGMWQYRKARKSAEQKPD